MEQTRGVLRRQVLRISASTALVLFALPCVLRAATATALVSATVLGPPQTQLATGAVLVAEVSHVGRIEISRSGRQDSRSLSSFRVVGGFHVTYAVALPETVSVKGESGEFSISGFRASGRIGRLASDGTATFEINATVS